MTPNAAIASEIQKLAPSAIVELFEIDATNVGGTVYRFHPGKNGLVGNVVWQGQTYTAFPIEASGFEWNGKGQLPRPKVKVANALGTITALVLAYDDLAGVKVTRIRTLAKYLDAANYPARRNLLLNSEEISSWGSSTANALVTANAALAPDGNQTADLWYRNSTGPAYRWQQVTKSGSAIQVTYSRHVYRQSGDYYAMRMQGNYPGFAEAVFRFSTESFSGAPRVSGSFSGVSGGIKAVAPGWYRVWITATTDTATILQAYDSFNSNGAWLDGTDSSASSSGLVWGAQLEVGGLTDYQPIGASFSQNPYADPTAEFPRDVYFVDRKAMETRDYVEFELASALDLAGVMLPRRQIVQNYCPWQYRGAECGYAGTSYFDANDTAVGSLAQDVCGKRLASCRKRFGNYGTLPYGGFPASGLVKL